MKKLFLLCFVSITLLSCSLDDDSNTNYRSEFLPIESILLPTEFSRGQTYIIDYSYLRPTTCHSYHDLYYEIDESTRTLAVVALVADVPNCQSLSDEPMERAFNFIVTQPPGTSYTFKIWKGVDNNDEDIFESIVVPVVD